MPATFAIGTLPVGIVTPTDCVVKQGSEKESIETYSYRDATGVTAHAVPGKLLTTEFTLEVIGNPPLSLLSPGPFTAGTYKLLSVKASESNEDFPTGTLTFKKFATKS